MSGDIYSLLIKTRLKGWTWIQPFIVSRRDPPVSCLPMFPKHTHAQKRTLAIHVRTAMLSWVSLAPGVASGPTPLSEGTGAEPSVAGIRPGLRPSKRLIPPIARVVDKMKPVLVRSIRYHSTGLARASVKDAWVVDSQGVRRCNKQKHMLVSWVWIMSI